jgi:hypothetical protein
MKNTVPQNRTQRKSLWGSQWSYRSPRPIWRLSIGEWDIYTGTQYQAGIGVVVEVKKREEVCEPCQLAVCLHRVSRRPLTWAETPFTRAYYECQQRTTAINGSLARWGFWHPVRVYPQNQERYIAMPWASPKNDMDAIWLLHLDGERTLGSDFDTLGLIITLRATSFSF